MYVVLAKQYSGIWKLATSVIHDTTTIKLTDNYRNNRTTYKLNSGLFSDTTAQRFVFYFFSHRTFLNTILASRTSGTFGFAPTHKADPSAKPKEPLFSQRFFQRKVKLLLTFTARNK